MTLATTSKGTILFACTMNSIRSPMAAALYRCCSRNNAVISAGLVHGHVDGFVITVMNEIGIDLSNHSSKTFLDVADIPFSKIITLSTAAHRHARRNPFFSTTPLFYWPVPEPDIIDGSREQVLSAYRETLANIGTRLCEHFPDLEDQYRQLFPSSRAFV